MMHRYSPADIREERFAGLLERRLESRCYSFFSSPSPTPPPPPPSSPAPVVQRDDAEIKARKKAERLSTKRRMGFGKTILTSGLGDISRAPVARKTLG